jgi:hypothetical protein
LLLGQSAADVVDGEVLLPEGDDLFSDAILLGSGRSFGARREEELPLGILAELMAQDPEAARSVAKAASGLGGGDAIDEVRAQGLVLAVERILGHQEDLPDGLG